MQRRTEKILKELDLCASQNLSLYEQYCGGGLDKAAFMEKKAGILKNKERLQAHMDELREHMYEAIDKVIVYAEK